MQHDIRFACNGLRIAIRINGAEQRNTRGAIFISHAPFGGFGTGQIELPQIAQKIPGIHKIHDIIKIHVDCNRAGKPVVVVRIRSDSGLNFSNESAGPGIENKQNRVAFFAVVTVSENDDPGMVLTIGLRDHRAAKRISHIVFILFRIAFSGILPQNILSRIHRIGSADIKGEIAFAAFAQTAHQNRLDAGAGQQFLTLFDTGRLIHIKLVLISGIGQIRQMIKHEIGHIGK